MYYYLYSNTRKSTELWFVTLFGKELISICTILIGNKIVQTSVIILMEIKSNWEIISSQENTRKQMCDVFVQSIFQPVDLGPWRATEVFDVVPPIYLSWASLFPQWRKTRTMAIITRGLWYFPMLIGFILDN